MGVGEPAAADLGLQEAEMLAVLFTTVRLYSPKDAGLCASPA